MNTEEKFNVLLSIMFVHNRELFTDGERSLYFAIYNSYAKHIVDDIAPGDRRFIKSDLITLNGFYKRTK